LGKVDNVEQTYGVAFSLPFLFLFFFFIIYPLYHGSTLLLDKKVWIYLFGDPYYIRSIYNSVIYVGLGVNIKMAIALFLSGLLTLKDRFKLVKFFSWIFVFPWVLPQVTALLGIRWLLNSSYGTVNLILQSLSLPKVAWFESYEGAISAIIFAHVWKFLPLWTLMLYAIRLTIPHEVYEAAEVDGASLFKKFINVTLPYLKDSYLFFTVLSTIWVIGDFTTPWLLTGGAPGGSTHVAATIGYVYAFLLHDMPMGLAAVMSILPAIALLLFIALKLRRRTEAK
jgi:multiple sugar transport system permease protein